MGCKYKVLKTVINNNLKKQLGKTHPCNPPSFSESGCVRATHEQRSAVV